MSISNEPPVVILLERQKYNSDQIERNNREIIRLQNLVSNLNDENVGLAMNNAHIANAIGNLNLAPPPVKSGN